MPSLGILHPIRGVSATCAFECTPSNVTNSIHSTVNSRWPTFFYTHRCALLANSGAARVAKIACSCVGSSAESVPAVCILLFKEPTMETCLHK